MANTVNLNNQPITNTNSPGADKRPVTLEELRASFSAATSDEEFTEAAQTFAGNLNVFYPAGDEPIQEGSSPLVMLLGDLPPRQVVAGCECITAVRRATGIPSAQPWLDMLVLGKKLPPDEKLRLAEFCSMGLDQLKITDPRIWQEVFAAVPSLADCPHNHEHRTTAMVQRMAKCQIEHSGVWQRPIEIMHQYTTYVPLTRWLVLKGAPFEAVRHALHFCIDMDPALESKAKIAMINLVDAVLDFQDPDIYARVELLAALRLTGALLEQALADAMRAEFSIRIDVLSVTRALARQAGMGQTSVMYRLLVDLTAMDALAFAADKIEPSPAVTLVNALLLCGMVEPAAKLLCGQFDGRHRADKGRRFAVQRELCKDQGIQLPAYVDLLIKYDQLVILDRLFTDMRTWVDRRKALASPIEDLRFIRAAIDKTNAVADEVMAAIDKADEGSDSSGSRHITATTAELWELLLRKQMKHVLL